VVDEDLARFRSLSCRCAAAVSLALLLLTGVAAARDPSRRDPLPSVVLWAWERPEDLRFVEPRDVGVAFLAATIRIVPSDGRIVARPRLQPLLVPPRTPLVAVVRIEAPGASAVSAVSAVAQRVAALQTFPGVREIQIDFDARASQQAFYRDLLTELRHRLPDTMPLSITALASWCLGDRWLDELPAGTIDDAVPMLFRMGPDATAVRSLLRSGGDFTQPLCRNSVGISTDEPAWRSDRRLYVFHPRAWDARAAATILESRRRAD